MIVDPNKTAIDVAFDVTGSLKGFPEILDKLPVGTRIGFDTLPALWEDITDVGQTWTPTVEGLNIDVSDMIVYNERAEIKAPLYTTPLYHLQSVIEYGNAELNYIITDETPKVPVNLDNAVYTQENGAGAFGIGTDRVIMVNPNNNVLISSILGGYGYYILSVQKLFNTYGTYNFKLEYPLATEDSDTLIIVGKSILELTTDVAQQYIHWDVGSVTSVVTLDLTGCVKMFINIQQTKLSEFKLYAI